MKLSADATLQQLSEEVDLPKYHTQDDLENITLIAITSLDPYFTCPKPTCRPRKMTTVKINAKYFMQCFQCNKQYQASNYNNYIVARMIASSSSGETQLLSIFKPEMEKMFELKGKQLHVSLNKDAVEEQILQILPAQFSVELVGTTVRSIYNPA